MINIVNGKDIAFTDYLLDEKEVTAAIENYVFTNGRPITRSMLAWWMYQDEDQVLIDGAQKLEIEHIFARKRQENEKTLKDKNNLEKLGNKVLLEEGINIVLLITVFRTRLNITKDSLQIAAKRRMPQRIMSFLLWQIR